MSELKLGQVIFVTTTLLLDGEVFKLHRTQLDDAVKNERGFYIKMSNNHNWGAVPTRPRKNVVVKPEDLDTLLASDILYQKYKNLDREKPRKNIYKASYCPRRMEVSIERFEYNQRVESLRDGKYVEYICGDGLVRKRVLKVYADEENLPQHFHYTMDGAVEGVREIIKNQLVFLNG